MAQTRLFQGFQVSQRAHAWFVTLRGGTELEFVDGMTF